MKKLLILAVLAAGSLSFAEPVPVTNAEASRLFSALRITQAGTTALNTRNGALDINALRPIVEAYEAGQHVIQAKAAKIKENDPDKAEKAVALNTEAAALSKAPNTVHLTLFALSDEELKDAKVTMDSLAEMLRFLTPGLAPAKK